MSLVGAFSTVWLKVESLDKSISFYQDILKMPVVSRDDVVGRVELDAGIEGIRLGLLRIDSSSEALASKCFPSFAVSDAARTAAELVGLGVKVDDPLEIVDKWLVYNFYDPEGNQLQLIETLFDTEGCEEY